MLSAICEANSLVGVKINALTLFGLTLTALLTRLCKIGKAKDAVFPVPVWAIPKISLPSSKCGIADNCIGVGIV